MQPGFDSSQTFTLLFEAALGRALDEVENWQRDRDDFHPLLIPIGEQCFKSGIPEEEAVRQVMMHYRRQADEQTVRTALHNLYRECRGFGRKSVLTPEQDTMLKLNEFMERRYEFRYNQLMGDLEYRQRDSIHFYFHVMDQRARNSVAMDALQEGLRVWDRDVNRYLTSNRVPLYNPVEEYLCGVGRWDGKDRIRALAGLVPCNNPYWREPFYRWFLNMVAHWRGLGNRMHANSTSPLLIGAQGYRKSTFCRIILPPEPGEHPSARLSETPSAKTRCQPAQALWKQHSGDKAVCLVHRDEQPQRLADGQQWQPPFCMRGSDCPH